MILKRFLYCLKTVYDFLEFTDIQKVEGGAFSNDSTVEYVKFDNELTLIEESAFEKCDNLRIVEIGSNKYIKTGEGKQSDEKNIWEYISNKQNKEIVSDFLTIQAKAFYNCSKLHTVILPDIKRGRGKGMLSVEKDVFTGCTSLRTVVFGTGDVKIHDQSFIGCNNVSFVCPAGSDAEQFAREHGIKIINV